MHDQTTADLSQDRDTHPGVEKGSRLIGGYRIIGKLGEGGMGIVYRAEQFQPRREVALKVIRGGGYISETHVKLFRREAQMLARMKHPGIATIYESGRTEDGQHFFAMELVQGETLQHYLRGRKQEGREELLLRLDLFRKICDAVSYAHQRAIIHRDLKPSNIMVLQNPAAGSSLPEIKILDFGLARITESDVTVTTLMTEAGKIMGTLSYMSPEQVRGNLEEIDLRSDVYSLGVILYQMLEGVRPYDLVGAGLAEAARVICEVPPRAFNKTSISGFKVDRDLEIITRKALEKNPAHRYQSVTALADDVGRYLAGQPIQARAPSTIYQFRKMVARHRLSSALAGTLLTLLVAFAVTMAVQAQRIASERDRASTESSNAQQVADFLVSLFEVSDPGEARANTITAREILDEGVERIDRSLGDQPLVKAHLLETMGRVHQNLGLFDSADSLYQGALAIRRNSLGAHDPLVARSLGKLGWLRQNQGMYKEAKSILVEAMEIADASLDPDDLDTAWLQYYQGTTLGQLGEHDAARDSFNSAMQTFVEEYGAEHEYVSWCLNDIGINYALEGMVKEARPYFERALEIKKKNLGPEHADVAAGMNNLGYLLMELEEYDEARTLLRRALDIREKTLEPDHPFIGSTLQGLGELERRSGNQEAALSTLERSLTIQEKAYGPSHEQVSWVLYSLAQLYQETGAHDEAEASYLRALGIREQSYGPDHPEVVRILDDYASLLKKVGREKEADAVLMRVASSREQDGSEPEDGPPASP